jgi:hypothetical protein
MPKPPIQQSEIIIGTYRTHQLPILPLLPLMPRLKKYNVNSRYLVPSNTSRVELVENKSVTWKKIYGS